MYPAGEPTTHYRAPLWVKMLMASYQDADINGSAYAKRAATLFVKQHSMSHVTEMNVDLYFNISFAFDLVSCCHLRMVYGQHSMCSLDTIVWWVLDLFASCAPQQILCKCTLSGEAIRQGRQEMWDLKLIMHTEIETTIYNILIDWHFISRHCAYIYINSTYKQIKGSMCIQRCMYHLVAARETTTSLSKLAAFRFNMVRTWINYKTTCSIRQPSIQILKREHLLNKGNFTINVYNHPYKAIQFKLSISICKLGINTILYMTFEE